MRLIRKAQSGTSTATFASYTPFASLLPATLQTATLQTTTTATKSSSSEDDISKNLRSTLDKVDALPNEMSQIGTQIALLSNSLTSFGASLDFGGTSSQYYSILTAIKIANFNKKEYDKAYQLAIKNEGLNEIAIGSDGGIYIYDNDNKLQYISYQEYLKNKSKYKRGPLTANNLLWLRAHDSQFVNNNEILWSVSNAIGMKEVVSLINLNLRSLGSSTQEIEGLVAKLDSKVMSGILELLKLADTGSKAAVDGIYKVKSKNVNSLKQMEAAISAIYQSLSPNAQALLMLKGGDSKDPLKAAKNLISCKVMAIMNDSLTYTEDYDHKFNPDGTPVKEGSSKKGDEDKYPQNVASLLLNGQGFKEDMDIVPGGNIGGHVTSITNVIPGTDNKASFDGKYLSELQNSGIAGIIDIKHATMGGYQIQNMDLVELLNTKMHAVWWPVKSDGFTPDLEDVSMDDINAANDEMQQAGVDPASQEGQAILAKHNIPNSLNLKQFIVLDGRTSNKALGVERFDSTPLLESVSDQEFDAYEKLFKSYWESQEKTKAIAKGLDLDHYTWFNPNDWFGAYDDVYKGTIWIPVQNNYANALAGTGLTITTDLMNLYERLQSQYDNDIKAQLTYNNPSQYD